MTAGAHAGRIRRACRGLSLFEVLVSAALLFTCITIAVLAFMAGSRNFAKGKESVERQEECRKVLEMISTELREADPTTITVSPSSVRFLKYHGPSSAFQMVTWRYDADNRKVVREYSVPPDATLDSTSLGERIAALAFTDYTRGAQFRKVGLSIRANAMSNAPGASEMEIISLATEVYVRARQPVDVHVVFDRSGVGGSSSSSGGAPSGE